MIQGDIFIFLACILSVSHCFNGIDTSDNLFVKCFTDETIYAFKQNNMQEIDPVCVKYFIEHIAREQKDLGVTDDQMNFLRSLERDGLGQIYERRRQKRQAGTRGRLIRRQECRALPDNRRNRLFAVMRYLKFRTGVYDFFAGLHRSLRSFRNAHIGSNFLGWHRVYLWYFERILIRVGGVPLCYWDSTLDYLIEGSGQRNTTMFTSEVVGNGIGMVINGPFRNWPIPERNVSLRREIASFASLMRPQVVDLIMTSNLIRNHSQISNGEGSVGMIDPDQGTRTSLESEHDNTHVWVGGVMSDATIAPQDPVFWLHHTYIDYVWEKFREKLFTLGINPANDYPGHGGDPHAADTQMEHFYNFSTWWTNANGYTNLFTQFVYTYDDHPTCGNGCGRRGDTNLLYCPTGGTGNQRCVATTAETDVSMFGGRSGTGQSVKVMAEQAALSEGRLNKIMPFRANYRDRRIGAP